MSDHAQTIREALRVPAIERALKIEEAEHGLDRKLTLEMIDMARAEFGRSDRAG